MIYTDLKYQDEPLVTYQYTLNLKNERQKGKNQSFPGVATSERGVSTRTGEKRVNMVDSS
jgi:hypothetical protein